MMSTSDAERVGQRLAAVHERVRAAGGDGVSLVAVSKTFPLEYVQHAVAAGQVDFGESYAQELERKIEDLDALGGSTTVRWHFIGGLQRNKVRRLAGSIALWQSIDRASLIDELAKRDPGARLLVQVNTAGSDRQGGCEIDEAEGLVSRATDLGLDVRGLMTIGPQGAPDVVATAFATLRREVDALGLAECSMGMSADLEIAIDQGATIVRVGSDIFGPRHAGPVG